MSVSWVNAHGKGALLWQKGHPCRTTSVCTGQKGRDSTDREIESNSLVWDVKACISRCKKRKPTPLVFPSFHLRHLFWPGSEDKSDKLCHCSQRSVSPTDCEMANVFLVELPWTTVNLWKGNSDHVKALKFIRILQVFLFIKIFFPPLKVNSRKKILSSQVILPAHYLHIITAVTKSYTRSLASESLQWGVWVPQA